MSDVRLEHAILRLQEAFAVRSPAVAAQFERVGFEEVDVLRSYLGGEYPEVEEWFAWRFGSRSPFASYRQVDLSAIQNPRLYRLRRPGTIADLLSEGKGAVVDFAVSEGRSEVSFHFMEQDFWPLASSIAEFIDNWCKWVDAGWRFDDGWGFDGEIPPRELQWAVGFGRPGVWMPPA